MSYITRRANPRLIYFPWHPNPKPLRLEAPFRLLREAEEGVGELAPWSTLCTQTKDRVPRGSISLQIPASLFFFLFFFF